MVRVSGSLRCPMPPNDRGEPRRAKDSSQPATPRKTEGAFRRWLQRSGSAIQGPSTQKSPANPDQLAVTAGLDTAQRMKPRMARMGTDKKYPRNPRNPWSKIPPPAKYHALTLGIRRPPNARTKPRRADDEGQPVTSRQTRGAPRRWLQ